MVPATGGVRLILFLTALVTLWSCSREQAEPFGASTAAEAPMERAMGGAMPEAAPAPVMDAAAPAPPPPGQPPVPGTPPGGVMLAYSYQIGVEVPAPRVVPVMKAHEDKCAKAGPAVCQVLGSSTNSYGENDIRAQLTLRGEPAWLKGFRDSLAGDAEAAGGEIRSESVTTEDLTRSIIDTDATLRTQREVRENLQAILKTRPGRLSDVLEVERELARVQQVIDSSESNLAVMRTRVAMSTLTLDYASAGAPVTDRTFEPIKEALVGFLRVVAEGFGAMITLLGVVLPWVLLLWLAAWLLKLWARRRQAAKAAKKAAEPA